MPKVTDEHRSARRQEILDAALRCVVREGFHKTTMADVIAESGLSAGAVYGYFKGKPDLIRAIAEQAVGAAAMALEEAVRSPAPVHVADVFAALLQRLVVQYDEHKLGLVALHAWSEAARDEQVRAIVRTQIAEIHQSWRRVLDRAEADGTLTPGLDHDALGRALLGLAPGFVLQGLLLGEVDAATYARGVADLMRSAPS